MPIRSDALTIQRGGTLRLEEGAHCDLSQASGGLLLPRTPREQLPDPAHVPGMLAYDPQRRRLLYSDGERWRTLRTSSPSGS
ncbi:MAG: hypothetical protein J7M05_00990 [Anaerolineae bacterium]|nr:hypothetical protein [Anaerolineae bacterium]